jgi:hypothetical protein
MKRNIRVPTSGNPQGDGPVADALWAPDVLEFDVDSPPDVPVRRCRRVLAAAAGLIVVTGLVVHFTIGGPAGDFVADALYAVLIFLLLSFVFVRSSSWRIAVAAFVICAGIELLQLTGLPATLAEGFPPVRLLLGTTFSAIDLVAYLVGVIGAAVVSTTRRLD